MRTCGALCTVSLSCAFPVARGRFPDAPGDLVTVASGSPLANSSAFANFAIDNEPPVIATSGVVNGSVVTTGTGLRAGRGCR